MRCGADAPTQARREGDSAAVQCIRERYLRFRMQLSHEPVGPTRTRLVRVKSKMRGRTAQTERG